jgi:hypothetical protein
MHKDYIIRAILDFKKKYIGEGGYKVFYDVDKTRFYIRKHDSKEYLQDAEYVSYDEMIEKINQLDKFTVIDGYTVNFTNLSIIVNWH